MPNIKTEVDILIDNLSENQKDWMKYFVDYMRKNHLAFSTAQNHFSIHSMDFEYIALLKEKLSIETIISRKVVATYGK